MRSRRPVPPDDIDSPPVTTNQPSIHRAGRVDRWRGVLEASPPAAVALGAGLAVLALAAKAVLRGITGEDVAYLTLFAILPVGALLGGFAAGAAVVLVGVVGDGIAFQSPVGSLSIADPAAFARFVLFVPVGLWIAWLVAAVARSRRAEAASARRLEGLLDGLPDSAIVVDRATGRVEYANQAMLGQGWAHDRLIGLDVDDLLPGFRSVSPIDREAINLGLRTEGGDEVPVEVLVRSVELPTGETRLLVSARDLRERIEAEVRLVRLARAERSHAQALQEVIASMTDGVALIGEDGRVVVANDALIRIAGGPIESESELAAAIGGDLAGGTIELVDPIRWVTVASQPLGGDAQGLHLVLLRDVTADREAAASRDAFLGILSHELRTPVTTILGTAHLLHRSRLDGATPAVLELVGDIAAEAQRLNYLIEDLLVLSRAQAGAVAIDPEPVLVQHALREAMRDEGARSPHVTFVADSLTDLPPVNGDQTFLAQVLRNLIGNAAKYGPTTPTDVEILAAATATEVSIRVLDRGPGFRPEDGPRLFDIFYRSDRTSRTRSGSGIGLYVARTLVEAMGGRIWAQLRDGGGAEFGFALPIAPSDESDAAAPSPVRD